MGRWETGGGEIFGNRHDLPPPRQKEGTEDERGEEGERLDL